MKQGNWATLLKFFTEQNKGRLTRLGVFEGEAEDMTDYWLASGLPFSAVDCYEKEETSTVEILLGKETTSEGGGFTHTVAGARRVKLHLSLESQEEGIDIEDMQGNITILRFEN